MAQPGIEDPFPIEVTQLLVGPRLSGYLLEALILFLIDKLSIGMLTTLQLAYPRVSNGGEGAEREGEKERESPEWKP